MPIAINTLYFSLGVFATVGFSLYVLSRRKSDPNTNLTWIITFIFLPLIGMIIFILVGYRSMERRKRSRPKPLERHRQKKNNLKNKSPTLRPIIDLCENLSGFEATSNNSVSIQTSSEQSYELLEQDILAAKECIYFEYYIFQADSAGTHFRDLLAKRASEGIRCRLLLDSIGCFPMTKEFLRPFRDAGGMVAFFGPLQIRRPWGFHLRNHRKLVAIDSRIAFIGSQNIGDEYYSRRHRKLSWEDVSVRLCGTAAQQVENLFCEDWKFTTGEALPQGEEFSEKTSCESVVQLLPTGPDEHEFKLEMILEQLIYTARSSIHIMTPYFAPSWSIVLALEAAGLRGISVNLMIPHRSDNKLMDWTALSWLPELAGAGVNIFLYHRTFLHTKLVLIDRNMALVGSANMDQRSFRINFEASVLLEDEKSTRVLLSTFERMTKSCEILTEAQFIDLSFFKRVRNGALRSLSSLL